MTHISKILIANRGEIACRVMRTARTLGIATVAVYSDADADAPHRHMADEAVYIGPSPVGESYLAADKIIAAAKQTDADAIHPGYGFLSENAAFSKACAEAGIVFIGPPKLAIEVMGDKARSKIAMIEAGVPCVPGYQGEDQTDAVLVAAAKDIGLPVMVKAAAGGGGRGMRLVHDEADLESAIGLARSEAENAFGSGVLIIEKAIQQPRHVEIQVFADAHGNVIHLGERDCSVQRRHQKVIEEAPCPVMTPDLRAAMGKAAVDAARAVDYRGAGTVEFLLGSDGEFYFLEMNTRLQVEHPVTEEVTGLDLVALQIAVARGEFLPLAQEDVTLTGHAIEVRLYAEDPAKDFLPSTGPILAWITPKGEGVRVDDGIASGGEVSPFYDAMVAKIIAYGDTREEARVRLVKALQETALFGLETNRDFLIDALQRPAFVKGEATTAFIGEVYGDGGFEAAATWENSLAPAVAIDQALRQSASFAAAPAVNPELLGWSSTGALQSSARYDLEGKTVSVAAQPQETGQRIMAGEEAHLVVIEATDGHRATLRINGRRDSAQFLSDAQGRLHFAGSAATTVAENLSTKLQSAEDEASGGTVTAAMHGVLLEVAVAEGQAVEKGARLAVLEAMKMQHEITANLVGTVTTIAAKAGEQLSAGDLILEIEAAE